MKGLCHIEDEYRLGVVRQSFQFVLIFSLHCYLQTSRVFDESSCAKKNFGRPSKHRDLYRKLHDPKPAIGGVLSEGVSAAVEGPCLVVEEFQRPNTSPKSKLDPSTPASTPPLRRFRPQQIHSCPRSGPLSLGG